MRVPVLNVRRDMLVIGADGRRYRAVDRELSPVGQGIRRPWFRLHLQDIESGAVSVVEYRPSDEVEVEWPPGVAPDAKPGVVADPAPQSGPGLMN